MLIIGNPRKLLGCSVIAIMCMITECLVTGNYYMKGFENDKQFFMYKYFFKQFESTHRFLPRKLEIPILNVIVDDFDGVNLGFLENAPTICIWDAKKQGTPIYGTTSFVFICKNLDATCDELNAKGLVFDPPKKFEWGTYELRLRDPDGNEVVIVEFQGKK